MMQVANTFPSGHETSQRRDTNWLPLLTLLMLVIPLRGWLMCNTEVLARDSVVYIDYAMEIEQKSWSEALNNNHQHPGYPWTILAVSVPIRWFLGPADAFTMQLSAQLASNLAAVLLIFPMYYLGRFFFERRVAFWGTLLYQYLPVSGQILSDGLSEPLALLLTSTAFLCAVRAMRRQNWLLFFACGIFCGLAYLTRPEAALIFASTLMVLAVGPMVWRGRQSWRANFRFGVSMTLAAVAVGSLYFGFTHSFTRKPSLGHILHGPPSQTALRRGGTFSVCPPQQGHVENVLPQKAGGTALFASIFGSTSEITDPVQKRLGKGLYIYVAESMRIFHYAGFLVLLFGMAWRLPRLFSVPEFLVPCLFVLLHSVVIIALVTKVGYLSNRHLLGVAAWGVYFAAAGFCDLPGWVRQWRLGRRPTVAADGEGWSAEGERLPPPATLHAPPARLPALGTSRMSLVLLLAFVALCMPRTAQRLHASQEGNHIAGLWLAQNLKKGDTVQDDHKWTGYYGGLYFQKCPEPPPGQGPKRYVVLTRSKDSKVQEQQTRQERELNNANGGIVYYWPETATVDKARVVIYAVDSPR
jgi:Dolichyl-phosphate-mannose-protein mannosyltransferase